MPCGTLTAVEAEARDQAWRASQRLTAPASVIRAAGILLLGVHAVSIVGHAIALMAVVQRGPGVVTGSRTSLPEELVLVLAASAVGSSLIGLVLGGVCVWTGVRLLRLRDRALGILSGPLTWVGSVLAAPSLLLADWCLSLLSGAGILVHLGVVVAGSWLTVVCLGGEVREGMTAARLHGLTGEVDPGA